MITVEPQRHRPRIISPRARLLSRIQKRSHTNQSSQPALPRAHRPRRSLASLMNTKAAPMLLSFLQPARMENPNASDDVSATTAHTKALQKEERKLAASFQIDPRITAPSCIPASQNLDDSDIGPDSKEDLKILSHHKPSNSAPLADLRMTFGKET